MDLRGNLKLKSSFLDWASYNPDSQVLTLTFKSGSVKRYSCGFQCVVKFLSSDSKGSYFNKHIKAREL